MKSKIQNPKSDALRILILENVLTDAELVKRELLNAGIAFTSMWVDTRKAFLQQLEDFSPDLVLSDYIMPQFNGMEALELVKKRYPSIPIIIVTGSMNEETAVECMKAGATDYVIKENLARLGQAVVGTLEKKQLKDREERVEEALRKSEHYFRSLLHSIHEDILVIDRDYMITDINKTFATTSGYDREDVRGRHCYEISRGINEPCHKHGEECMLGKVFETGESRDCRHEHVHADGSKVLVDILFSPLTDEKGNVTHVIEAMRDVTDLYRKEEALRKSEKKYGLLLSNLPSVVLRGYKSCFVEFIDNKVELLTGYSMDEFNSRRMKWSDLVVEEDFETARLSFILALKSDKAYIRNYRIKTKKGEICWIEERSRIICDATGEIEYVDGVFFNITKRKQAEEKIKKYSKNLEHMVEERTIEHKQAKEKIKEYSENLEAMVEERAKELDRALHDTEEARDRIDGILKSVADGLIVTDIYNRIILMNRAAEDLLGVRFSEVIDLPIYFAIQEKTLRDRIKSTLEKRKTDYQFDFELPGENAKHPRIMRARTSGIKDKTGNHTGIITIIHDVTHEREVDRMKTEFISTAAHEFRAPLTSIQGFSEILLMREDLKPEEKKKFLTHINNQSVSLANIINDLLDISRIESGLGFSLNKAPCDMADIIRGLALQFQEQTSKHYFEVILPEESVELEADKEKIEPVLQNLLNNAVKYSPEGGTICLSAKKISDSAIEISIADQGIGMTPEQVEKIFDKFYRADPSDRTIEGTGLGMNIVKCLVEAHEGKVWVESEPGKGTIVTFTIPI